MYIVALIPNYSSFCNDIHKLYGLKKQGKEPTQNYFTSDK